MAAIDQVIEVDLERIRAMTHNDVAALSQILADELIYTHSSGRLDDKESLIEGMTSGTTVYRQIDLTDIQARDYGEAVALVGSANMHISVSGQPLEFPIRFTNLYVRRDEKWQMAVWQSTKLPK